MMDVFSYVTNGSIMLTLGRGCDLAERRGGFATGG